MLPSEASSYIQRTNEYLKSYNRFAKGGRHDGLGMIFIVGMPRSGSSLLERALSIDHSLQSLGETSILSNCVFNAQADEDNITNHSFHELYRNYIRPLGGRAEYTLDKQLYNYQYVGIICHCLPAAKIIYCKRHPMDNILSMMRSNLGKGNNYCSCPSEAALVMTNAMESMSIYISRYPGHIYTFDYDEFVGRPEETLAPLLDWLQINWNPEFLHPEKNTRPLNTASDFQARQLIHTNSSGAWIHYKNLLDPARQVFAQNGLFNISIDP